MPEGEVDMASWGMQQRGRINATERTLFDSLLLLITWAIWKERNGRIFGRPAGSAADVVCAMCQEGEDWAMAGFAPLAALVDLWS